MLPPRGIARQSGQGGLSGGGVRIRSADEPKPFLPGRFRQISWLCIYLGGFAWMGGIAYALWRLLLAMAHSFLPGISGMLGALWSAVLPHLA